MGKQPLAFSFSQRVPVEAGQRIEKCNLAGRPVAIGKDGHLQRAGRARLAPRQRRALRQVPEAALQRQRIEQRIAGPGGLECQAAVRVELGDEDLDGPLAAGAVIDLQRGKARQPGAGEANELQRADRHLASDQPPAAALLPQRGNTLGVGAGGQPVHALAEALVVDVLPPTAAATARQPFTGCGPRPGDGLDGVDGELTSLRVLQLPGHGQRPAQPGARPGAAGQRGRLHLAAQCRRRRLDPALGEGQRDAQIRVESALWAGELELHYQPKIDALTDALIGVEALIRWKHPELGLRLPGEFLPAVSESSFEIELGNWVLATAAAQLDSWRAAGMATPISVNISARHLAHPDFVPHLKRVLDAHPELDPELLQLEVLESATLGDMTHVAHIMAACNELGVSFAIDDFGTGYGALSSLRRLPVRSIKIDRSIVHNMLDDADDMATVQGMIGLASAFHREVIASGVETPRHRQALLQLGCHLVQGHGIARPMPAAHMQRWMRAHATRH